jgi:ribonuclease HI
MIIHDNLQPRQQRTWRHSMNDSGVTVYTDGSSLGNPGPGGWAAILVWGDARKEISKGYLRTTNNRMEIRGVIHALTELSRPCRVHVHTDSRYVCDAISKKWIQSWIRNGWLTAAKKPVKNRDLWERLLPLLQRHEVCFHWLKAHNGHPENERCDELAKKAAMSTDLKEDEGYENNA